MRPSGGVSSISPIPGSAPMSAKSVSLLSTDESSK
jgi:hypothetical protein